MAEQRLGGAVDRRQRRPQLVRGGRDEARLQLLELPDIGHVSERVDRPAEELDPSDGNPALSSLGLDRNDDLGVSRIGRRSDRHRIDSFLPTGDRIGGGPPDDVSGADRSDPLGGGVPKTDGAAAIEEQDAVGDVGENTCRVGALLDLRIQPRPIDSERDPPGDVLYERKVVSAVRLFTRGPSDSDRAQRAPAGAERTADHGAGIDPGEEPTGVLAVGAAAQWGHDLRRPARDHRADGVVRLLRRGAVSLGAPRLGAGDGEALQRRAFFGQVDETPVAEVADDERGGPLDRRLVVERRCRLGDLAKQVEPALPFGRLGSRRSLRRHQPITFLLRALPLADVDEEALSEERATVSPCDRRCVLAQPDDFAVPSEHPVFSLKRRAVLVGARDLVEDAVAIVGMENPRQQLAVPLVGRVAELRLDLRADEPRIVAIADRIDPGHERKAVRQVAVLAVGVGQVLVNSTLRGQAIRLPTIESSRQQARD